MEESTNTGNRAAHPDALAEAVQATRALIGALRIADAPEAALDRAAALVREATLLVEPYSVDGLRAQSGLRFNPDIQGPFVVEDLAHFFPYSPVVGPLSPIAPPVELTFDGERMHGRATLGAQFTGPPGGVHGGVIALVFDELLGGVCVCRGLGAFTGTLSIRYERFTPVDSEVKLEAWIDRTERRKVFVVGEMRVDGALTARAEGIFVRAEQFGG